MLEVGAVARRFFFVGRAPSMSQDFVLEKLAAMQCVLFLSSGWAPLLDIAVSINGPGPQLDAGSHFEMLHFFAVCSILELWVGTAAEQCIED